MRSEVTRIAFKRVPLSVFALLLLFSTAPTLPAQILVENGGVTSPSTPTWRETLNFQVSEELEQVRLDHQLLVGLTPKLELSLTLPTILHHRASFLDTLGQHESEAMAGVGDPRLRLKLNLFQEDDVMKSTRFALLGRITAPLGNDDRNDGGVRIPRQLQLGTGAWEMAGGAVFTLIRDRHRFSTNLYYAHRTRHEGVRLGSSIEFDLAYWYRLQPARFDSSSENIEIRGVIELQTRYHFSGQDASSRIGDRGFLLSIAPGIHFYPTSRLLFEANVQIPLLQTRDDALGERRWGALIGFKLLF